MLFRSRKENFIKTNGTGFIGNNYVGDMQIPEPNIIGAKRAVTGDVPSSYIGQGSKASGKGLGSEITRDIFQDVSRDVEPALKDLGQEIRKLGGSKRTPGVIDLFESYQNRQAGKQLFGLGDMISSSGAFLAGGAPAAIATMAVKKGIESPTLMGTIGKTLKSSKGFSLPKIKTGRIGKTYKAISPFRPVVKGINQSRQSSEENKQLQEQERLDQERKRLQTKTNTSLNNLKRPKVLSSYDKYNKKNPFRQILI